MRFLWGRCVTRVIYIYIEGMTVGMSYEKKKGQSKLNEDTEESKRYITRQKVAARAFVLHFPTSRHPLRAGRTDMYTYVSFGLPQYSVPFIPPHSFFTTLAPPPL